MRTKLILQLILLTGLLVTTPEGFFFLHPKKLIKDILQAVKDKKEVKKVPSVHHYHVHYYPLAHPLSGHPVKAPTKEELDGTHKENLAALGWSDHEYKFVPESKIKIFSSVHDTWKNSLPWDYESIEEDLMDIKHRNANQDIYVKVPINQNIIIKHPYVESKQKNNLLSTFFEKIKDIKNSIQWKASKRNLRSVIT